MIDGDADSDSDSDSGIVAGKTVNVEAAREGEDENPW